MDQNIGLLPVLDFEVFAIDDLKLSYLVVLCLDGVVGGHAHGAHAPEVLHRVKALGSLDPPGSPHSGAPDTKQQVRQPGVLLLLDVGDVAHDDVDQGVLHQAEEHEHRAAGHEHVNGLENGLV